jgi:hypothetical protein
VNRAVALLVAHAPKLLLRRRALEFSQVTYFGGMIQKDLHLLGMTSAEHIARAKQQFQQLQERRERWAVLLATEQAAQQQ